MARPQKKLSEDQIVQVEALASVLSKEQICDYLGLANNTFDAICERQPEVFERYKKGKSIAIATVAKNLINQARKGNTTAIIFYLKTQAGWRERQEIDHTSSDGSMTPKQQINLSGLSDEELEILESIAIKSTADKG